MPVIESIGRRQCIPIIYTRGTHYEVGFDVGRNFASIIQSFLEQSTSLHEDFLPAYDTPEGRKAYEDTLNCVKANFPQYIDELQGTADGAKVPFHELFLLHMDNIILNARQEDGLKQPYGCSTICVNRGGQEILGHTEDALKETLNHFYFVSAHIISDKPQGRWNVTEEKFTSLCYAGHLPGYTMSYNHHGLVFSINTLSAKNLRPGKTPRHFLTRALLAAENFVQAQQILRDSGNGAGDGCSVNMTFLEQEGDRLFHNVEMGPTETENESQLNVLTASPGEYLLHCNSYLRLPVKEVNVEMLRSSEERMAVFKKYDKPKCEGDVIEMLGDDSNKDYPVFRDTDFVRTIAVGIFDCVKRTWSLYSDNPKHNEPLVVLPLVLKSDNK
ncbi:beta-alanyl-dopamine/carcinine hydrolase [Tribolium castaneum]|uniref:Peptidase C45 hydrolase domain-containing protein n=1 Tax=Tribolium castaneum TaxID=7070 RepID=D6WGK9_TRICA|nr:PREDICTED: uncharacterized protein LOC660531 [Tribolium castaneum]EFA00578.1 hypothetical protein TcasGA2_TC003448 [Tribolium castaneum]|eukprot:XP_971848.1 PREDICTED: uncharacterized protein LOC660531 [Tribolium castaneum]